MQNGPKADFTTFEREKFKAICVEWKEAKNHTRKTFAEWSAEKLGGKSSPDYIKFVSYLKIAQAVKNLNDGREKVESAQQEYVQAISHLRSLQAHKANLERQIQSDTQRIESSREQTAKRIASHVGGINMGPGKRQY